MNKVVNLIVTYLIIMLNYDFDYIAMNSYELKTIATAVAALGHDVLASMIIENYVNEGKDMISRMLAEDVVWVMKGEK